MSQYTYVDLDDVLLAFSVLEKLESVPAKLYLEIPVFAYVGPVGDTDTVPETDPEIEDKLSDTVIIASS